MRSSRKTRLTSTPIVPSSPSPSSQASQNGTTNDPLPGSNHPVSMMTLQQPPGPIPAAWGISPSLPSSPTTPPPPAPSEHVTSTPPVSVTTSGEQEPANAPAGCTHLIHPAYSDTYTHSRSMCPSCRLAACVSDVRTTGSFIMKQGGIQPTPTGEEQKRQLALQSFYKGQHKLRVNEKVKRCHESSEGVSYPRSRTTLLRMIAYLEDLRQLEQTWEAQNPANLLPADSQRRLAESKCSSATHALDCYQSYIKDDPITKVEKHCLKSSLKRGREWEMSTLENYPDPQDPFERSSFFQLTKDQNSFINAHLVSDDENPTEYDLDLAPPKRKRRRLDASVEFDSLVYVRTEADIDLLYKPPTTVSTEPQATSAPRGILRTIPRSMDPRSKRPHDVRHLELGNKDSAQRRVRKGGVPTPGYTRVDTSGYRYRNDWNKWYGYIAALHAEPIEAENVSLEEPAHQVPEDDGLNEDELRTEANHAALERQIAPTLVTRPYIRQTPSPKRQLGAELGRLRSANSGPMTDELILPALPPHGGMASAFTFGGFIAEGMLGLVRKTGIL